MFNLTGKLAYKVSFTETGNPIVTMELNEKHEALNMVDALHDEKLSVKICKASNRRSIDANSYYWLLLNRLSTALKISRPHCHNLMLRRYGVLEEFDGKVVYLVLPDTEEASKKADEAEEYHIKPTSSVREGNDGIMYRTYLMLKGSHAYNKSEFKNLVNGLVDECRQMNIPTIRQEDIDSLLSQWGE